MRSALTAAIIALAGGTSMADLSETYDVVVVGATPGGIMAAIGASRLGKRVLLLDRNEHIGGLPANGLGATDIATRGCAGGLFREFVDRIRQHYVDTYGEDSQQVTDCSSGFRFEPQVGSTERTITASVTELLLEASRLQDEENYER